MVRPARAAKRASPAQTDDLQSGVSANACPSIIFEHEFHDVGSAPRGSLFQTCRHLKCAMFPNSMNGRHIGWPIPVRSNPEFLLMIGVELAYNSKRQVQVIGDVGRHLPLPHI